MKLSSLQKGLVAYYPLDRESLQSATTFADKTPYENVGTKYGSVLKFDGTDDCIRIPDSESLSPTSAMSAMCWVKGAAQIGKVVLAHYDGGINQKSIAIFVNYVSPYNKIRVLISGDGIINQKVYDSSIVAFDNTWHLIGFTFDAGTFKLFVDGEEDTNPTKIVDDAITTIHNSTADVMVGCYLNSGTPTGFFDGSIGDTRIYSRALTPAEILTMYQGGVVDDTDLEAHYTMKDKSGVTLTDETGVNNGTLTNFADITAGYGNTHDSGWNTDATPNVFATDRMGQTNRAMSFDGVSDYVDCGNDASLDITGEITISAWVKRNSIDGQIIFQRGKYNVKGYELFYFGTKYQLRTYQSGVNQKTYSINFTDINVWEHIVATRNGTSAKIYINGVDVTDTTENHLNPTTSTDNAKIGIRNTNDYFFDGSLADARIYNRALSETEIGMLYENYRPKVII